MNRDDIIRMAREAGLPKWYQTDGIVNEELVVKFANLVAAAEREACAKVCEDLDDGDYAGGDQPYGIHYARAIRKRGAP